MPSAKELAKALAYRGEIRNTPQNSFLGGVANFLAPVSEFADQYKISDRIPFLGGMSAADLTGLKGAQSLVNDMSYGKSPISGASLQTTKVDPRVIDLAGVSGAMMPVGKALGKAALREGARQIETGTGIGRAALDPRMMAVHAGGMFPGKKIPSVDTLAKVKDKFIYHSGVADDIDNMKYGIEPTNQGDWVREVASGAVDDVDNLLEQSTPLSWFSDKPDWVAAKVARKLGKNFADVTDEDIIKHGHVAMIPRKGDHASDIYKVGEEGLSNGGYSRVTNLRGEEMPAHQTDLYQENNYGQQIEPFGVERNEYITAQPVEPMFQLNGQELLDFMRKSGTRSNPSNVGGAMMQRPKTEFEILHDTAQRNAALPVEQGGLGLPKGNTAMDRAGVMGFDTDTPYYHGTDYDFDKFNTAGKQKTAGAGAFLTNNPVVAETYVGGVGSGGNIMPLLARKENLLEVNAKGRNWSDINTNDLAHKRKKLSNIFPNDISPNDSTTTDQIAALAPYADFSGALIKNIRDSGPSSHVFRSKEYLQDKYGIPNTGSDTYWNDVTGDQFAEARNATDKLYSKQRGDVLSLQNPQDIRSRFAAFDPFRRHEADILAGVGVGGMLDPQAIAEALRQQDRK